MDCTMDEGEPEYTVSYRYYEQTGYFQKKYININSYNEGKIEPFGKQMFPGISSQTSQQLLQIADLIHIRFADVLLMQSELKQDATGLNKVRARSHLAPVAYSLEAIKQERRWELAFESIRWWDILRWSGPSLEEAGDILNKQWYRWSNSTIRNAYKQPKATGPFRKTKSTSPMESLSRIQAGMHLPSSRIGTICKSINL